jgi:hypothetical protein
VAPEVRYDIFDTWAVNCQEGYPLYRRTVVQENYILIKSWRVTPFPLLVDVCHHRGCSRLLRARRTAPEFQHIDV